MAAFDIAKAQLVSLFFEAALYGLLLASFGSCVRALLWNGASFRGTAHVKWALLAVACLMCAVATLDIALNLRHNLEAFVLYTGPGGPDAEFSDLSAWINVARGVTFGLQPLIGDAVLIYRCFIVYNRNIYITLPLLLIWLGTAVCAAAIPYTEARGTSGSALITTVPHLNAWVTATVVATLVLNVAGTVMIALRVWRVSRRTADATQLATGRGPLAAALRIIVESGALYTLTTLALFGVSVAKSNAVYPVSDGLIPIIGICFNLIIVRVSWHASAASQLSQSHSQAHSRGGIPLHFVSQHPDPYTQSQAGPRMSVAITRAGARVPVQVTVTRDVEFAGDVDADGRSVDTRKEPEMVEEVWAR